MRAPELADAAGISYRQVDYWTHAGWLVERGTRNPGPGSQRDFAPDQLRVARTMARLIDTLGLPPPRAHHVTLQLIERGRARVGDFTITLSEFSP